jgi:hypothetical protein
MLVTSSKGLITCAYVVGNPDKLASVGHLLEERPHGPSVFWQAEQVQSADRLVGCIMHTSSVAAGTLR